MLSSASRSTTPTGHFQHLLKTHEWSLCASEQAPWSLLRARPRRFELPEVPAQAWPLDGVVLFSERVTSVMMVGNKPTYHEPACVFVLDGARAARAYALTLAHMMLDEGGLPAGAHAWLEEAATKLFELLVAHTPSTLLASMRRPFHERARSVIEALNHQDASGRRIHLRTLLVSGERGVPDLTGCVARLIDLVLEPCPEGAAGNLFNAAYVASAHSLALTHGVQHPGDTRELDARTCEELMEASVARAAPLVFACCERLIAGGFATRLT